MTQQIKIHDETYLRLKRRKYCPSQSFNDLIVELLDGDQIVTMAARAD